MLSTENEKLITKLINLKCFKHGVFTLKSGKKSNYYIDLRCLVSHPTILKEICELLKQKIDTFENTEKKLLCGLPYAGLPYAFGISMLSDIPLIMLRKEPKKHGTAKMIEGSFQKDEELILIDDILTSGTSILESLEHLKDFKITTIFIVVDRDEGGKEKLEKLGYKVISLFTINDFIRYESNSHST